MHRVAARRDGLVGMTIVVGEELDALLESL